MTRSISPWLLVAASSLAGCYHGVDSSPGADSDTAPATDSAGRDADGTQDDNEPGDDDEPTGGSDGEDQEWDPEGPAPECNVEALLGPAAFGAKAKTLLTGLPLTDDELLGLEANPDALAGMIDGWLQLPQSDAVLERFFRTAFQLTSGSNESLFHLFGVNAFGVSRFRNPDSAKMDVMLNKNFADSFAKTAAAIARDGVDFREVVRTDTYMMTTAMMSFVAFNDDSVVPDLGSYFSQDWQTTRGHFPTIRLLRDPPQPPLEEVTDPNHPNWMTFYSSKITEEIPAGCGVGPVLTVNTNAQVPGEWTIGRDGKIPWYIFDAMVLGRVENVRRHEGDCSSGGAGSVGEPLLSREDFTDWRPVKIRPPAEGEDPSFFYQILQLRQSDELRIHGQRFGFLNHPAFLSTWITNEDNSMRVIVNQALIVALGASFDGETVTDFTPEALNEDHAAPGTECYGCHQQLDPMRDFYRASLTNHYGRQTDPERANLTAQFVLGGVEASGQGLGDFADILAEHPLFPYAWAHKLCWYANAEGCREGVELDRVVGTFVESGHDFRVLIRELFSSPLVTGERCVDGQNTGTQAVISRRSTFCQNMSERLGVEDVCGLSRHTEDSSTLQRNVARAAASIPDDAFSRAVVEPIIIAQTGLFTRANREAACDILAQDAYELAFAGLSREEVIETLVSSVMGLPASDDRHDEAVAILDEHVTDVVLAGELEGVGLQSATAVACMSPGAAGVGF